MLIEVVALQPPHHYEGVVTIHFKKLLTGEPGQVNSVCGGGFTQEKTCYCANSGKSFHGGVLCFALRAPGRHGQGGRVKPPPHSITSSARASTVAGTSRPSALAVFRLALRRGVARCRL